MQDTTGEVSSSMPIAEETVIGRGNRLKTGVGESETERVET